MKDALKRLLLLCVGGGILMAAVYNPFATSASEQKLQPPEPTLIEEQKNDFVITGEAGKGNNETPGAWYAGAAPPNLLSNAPVLLFVPGLNSTAQVFWKDNDMYQTAYDAGYQTAFIQLHDAGGASADMWDNGELLAENIRDISAHFDGKPMTIIGHSKGGVDAQAALTYYGAEEHVENVITLSSPHHGSQLADLAYSSWAGWLADLIGSQGEGTYAMQMGYMEHFRTETDDQPLAYYNAYFSLGGTDWGSIFSSTWFGGTYLSQFGDSDGVVTTASSRLPGGYEIMIGDWDHFTMRTGATFSAFEDYISGSAYNLAPNQNSESERLPAYNQWIHGGSLSKGTEKTISLFVEENVGKLQLHMLTADQLSSITLTDPSGKETIPELKSHQETEAYFAGAISNGFSIAEPNPGEWQLHIEAEHDDAYLLMADFQTNPKLYRTKKDVEENQLMYQLDSDHSQVLAESIRATYHVTDTKNPSNTKIFAVNGSANMSQRIQLEQANTVYNITVDISGKTKERYTFKRTVVDSVYY